MKKFTINKPLAKELDGNALESSPRNQNRVVFIVLLAALVLGAIGGYLTFSGIFSGDSDAPKTFSADSMSITLTDDFKEKDEVGYVAVYESKRVSVFVLKELFSFAEGLENYSTEQFAGWTISYNDWDNPKIMNVDGLTFFEYKSVNPETKDTNRFISYVYKADDSFWMIQFAVRDKYAEEYAPKIAEWAKSVEFSD